MLKDLSEAEVKLGKQFIESQKAQIIGTIIAGPLGGVAASTGSLASNGYFKTSKQVKAEEKARKAAYDENKKDKELGKMIDESSSNRNKSESNSNNQYSKAEKQQKMSAAKKDGQYDIYFLEAIQNSKILYDGNTKAINKEYEKYLEDPHDYFKKRGNLEEA